MPCISAFKNLRHRSIMSPVDPSIPKFSVDPLRAKSFCKNDDLLVIANSTALTCTEDKPTSERHQRPV